MIKFLDPEEIINLENSEDYGILHVSNFKPFGRYKKFYVYRLDKNATVIQSNPFISDLEGWTRKLKKKGIKLYFDSEGLIRAEFTNLIYDVAAGFCRVTDCTAWSVRDRLDVITELKENG